MCGWTCWSCPRTRTYHGRRWPVGPPRRRSVSRADRDRGGVPRFPGRQGRARRGARSVAVVREGAALGPHQARAGAPQGKRRGGGRMQAGTRRPSQTPASADCRHGDTSADGRGLRGSWGARDLGPVIPTLHLWKAVEPTSPPLPERGGEQIRQGRQPIRGTDRRLKGPSRENKALRALLTPTPFGSPRAGLAPGGGAAGLGSGTGARPKDSCRPRFGGGGPPSPSLPSSKGAWLHSRFLSILSPARAQPPQGRAARGAGGTRGPTPRIYEQIYAFMAGLTSLPGVFSNRGVRERASSNAMHECLPRTAQACIRSLRFEMQLACQ